MCFFVLLYTYYYPHCLLMLLILHVGQAHAKLIYDFCVYLVRTTNKYSVFASACETSPMDSAEFLRCSLAQYTRLWEVQEELDWLGPTLGQLINHGVGGWHGQPCSHG